MRKILFRAKRIDNGEWIYGYLVKLGRERLLDPERYGICNKAITIDGIGVCYNLKTYEIIPETVGQYTGLLDKDGKKIFEGDIIRVDDTENAVVEYDETSAFYMAVFDRAESDFGSLIEQYPNVEIIGNIHDNPELSKGSDR